jgi:formylglycine-generating enzyme required for sulfatase activity
MNTPAHVTWEADGKAMAHVAGGRFLMGCNEGPAKHQPQHEVDIDAFLIDRYPVTNREYKVFVDAADYPVPCYDVSWCDTRDYNWDPERRSFPDGRADHPVVLVAWQDAFAYARWAGKRLPTEAEWEAAARGPDGRTWPWGDELVLGRCNTVEAELGTTTPVHQYVPDGDSPAGVSDMIGNVWEWTSSLFRPYPYNSIDGRENTEPNGWRVLRGGSWFNHLYMARSYTRLDGDFLFFNNVGFRCAASLSASPYQHPEAPKQH